MIQAFHKAGLPPGVLNLVTGAASPCKDMHDAEPDSLLHRYRAEAILAAGRGSEIGDYLTTHPLVNCISFTGGDTGDT